MDARVLVVAEEKALFAPTLIAAHGVDTCVLAPTIVELAFIHIYGTFGLINSLCNSTRLFLIANKHFIHINQLQMFCSVL